MKERIAIEAILWEDATELASRVRRREISPAELASAAAERIEALNPAVNAVVATFFDQAAAQAEWVSPRAPFAGVPLLLKDLGMPASGTVQRQGSRFLRGAPSARDSHLVARLRSAGFVFLGRTSTSEFGLRPTTEPLAYGPCANPWDRRRSAGGSSGGSAAAVACGMVPVATGSDGGGSLRIPASCCGVFGLMPSRGRVSPAPGGDLFGLGRAHALTRSVRDSAALLDVLAGAVPGDPYACPPPARPFGREVGAPTGCLRIAFTDTSPLGGPVDERCSAAVRAAAHLLEALGHRVEEASPNVPTQAPAAFMTVWQCLAAASVDAAAKAAGRLPGPGDLEPLTREMARRGRETGAGAYLEAVSQLQGLGRSLAAFLSRYDLWLTPTLAAPPAPLGSLEDPGGDYDKTMELTFAYTPFAALINPTGLPAMSVPLSESGEGLPLGVHFVGRFGGEATLFRLAAQLEQARPWAGRRPPI